VFKVPSGRFPDHFMPWAHPFTSVINRKWKIRLCQENSSTTFNT
jgi:hypothetical protein